ncbi:helix-turn-helix domain-containing protein [Butyricimonas sp. Marseille-P3923]|uniref:helix-turn-helix domain-containing protein n=1 Tax=Butyricimonas sp. Marseille-P3923 TaxID=1987504 RepID=UPI000C07537D|nr:helix-turn-helix domain-containing protein [Butyricimonas sp. Marseille-P3923]
MMNDSLFSATFWMYFSYVLSFVIPLFCGITLLILKGATYSEEAGMHPRRVLGVVFTLSGLLFIPDMIQDIHAHRTNEFFLPGFDITIHLFLIPMYFFYFRKLTKPEKIAREKIWLHFIPGIVMLVAGLLLFLLEEKESLFQREFYDKNSLFSIFRYICLTIQASMITVYTSRILKLKREHVQTVEENYSSKENIDLRWLNHAIPLAILYAVIMLCTSFTQAVWSNYLVHLSFICFVPYLFIHALNEPYICYTPQHAQVKEEPLPPCEVKSCPDELTIEQEDEISPVFPPLPEKYLKNLGMKREKMKDELVHLFDEKEIYTNGNLTINDVAALLGTNRTYISNLINNEFGFSFYQFVNKYRIQKATILFIEHPEMQIQEVASLVGFNSLSSFISSFKLNEGITPKQWKQRYVEYS